MACGGKVSEERTTETLIKKVLEEELKDIPLQDVPFLTPDAVEEGTEQEKAVVKNVCAVVRKIGEKIKDDTEIQEGIHGLAQLIKLGGVEGAHKMFQAVSNEMFQAGITWEKIVSLLYVVGKVVGILAGIMVGVMVGRNVGRMVMPLCASVPLILSWTLDFFKKYVLGWILERGGWIRCTVQS